MVGSEMDRIGIIGGTGLIDLAKHSKSLDGIEIDRIDEVLVETKYGEVPLTCIKLSKNAQTKELIFLQRHHNNGKPNMPPHNINHKANISALNDANCEAIVSVCSVGAIAECLPPGKVVLAGQYIDFTGVATSFFDEFAVFTSVTEPFCENNFHFLIFWHGWKKASEIFYSILIYNSLIALTSKSKSCDFISWHENQITNRAYSLGVSSVRRKTSSNRLISFNGSL